MRFAVVFAVGLYAVERGVNLPVTGDRHDTVSGRRSFGSLLVGSEELACLS
jgi:hypothetical protein